MESISSLDVGDMDHVFDSSDDRWLCKTYEIDAHSITDLAVHYDFEGLSLRPFFPSATLSNRVIHCSGCHLDACRFSVSAL